MSSNTKIVDARGLSCPQPVMLTGQVIKKLNKGSVEVLVDSGTARDNVERLAKNSGWAVNIEDRSDGCYRLMLQK